jgi:multiple sugar transport system substrate-binding protein
MTFRDYKDTFVDVAVQELTDGGEIYAIPLYIDTLALYYNKDIFDTEGVAQPPKTWNDFITTVERLTRFDNEGHIERAGAAIGTSRNVNRSTDILSLLMLQSGVEMVNDDFTLATFSEPVQGQNVGEIALQFYTDFANPTKRVYTWNDEMFYSIDAFFTGQTAIMFNYSHHVKTLREKAPRFRFDVAPMPQIEDSETINYANYWAPTVSEFSEAPVAAWRFLKYLSSPEGVIPYLNASERPVARRDLVEEQSIETELGVFAEQALSAFSWYQADNSAVETIFADMIDDINLNRASIREALSDAETKVNLIMQR